MIYDMCHAQCCDDFIACDGRESTCFAVVAAWASSHLALRALLHLPKRATTWAAAARCDSGCLGACRAESDGMDRVEYIDRADKGSHYT